MSGHSPSSAPPPRPGARQRFGGEDIIHAAAVLEPPPGIDGDLAEWAFLVYSLQEPNLGVADWEGPQDLPARGTSPGTRSTCTSRWRCRTRPSSRARPARTCSRVDSLEVWFDADLRGDGATTVLNADDFQLGLLARQPVQPTRRARSLPLAAEYRQETHRYAVVVGQLLDGRYALEVAIPWSVFKVTPSAGQSYGIALALNDDDTPGSAEQQSQVTNGKGQNRPTPRRGVAGAGFAAAALSGNW